MNRSHEIDERRRLLLIRALAAGLLGAALPSAEAITFFGLFGSRPQRLPAGQSVYGLSGEVLVNDQSASLATPIQAGDTVQTGRNSEIVFVVDGHSMILRADSKLQIERADNSAASLLIGGLRMLSGKLLSVSRNSSMRVTSSTATIGIRGTGFYVEADPEQTYLCVCYGQTDVQATDDPSSREEITSTHHDHPVYIVKDGNPGNNIRSAPFLNHTDQELALIETLVGRKTPFVFPNEIYNRSRRSY